jgi:hypothetical protein
MHLKAVDVHGHATSLCIHVAMPLGGVSGLTHGDIEIAERR